MAPSKKIRLKVASPCNESWDRMQGDDAVRFCGKCQKNVYQLSNMSTSAVEELLASKGDGLCARFYQRKDGTILTADCSVGATRRRRKAAVLGAGAAVAAAVSAAMWPAGPMPTAEYLQGSPPMLTGEVPPRELMGVVVRPPDMELIQGGLQDPSSFGDNDADDIMGEIAPDPVELPEPTEDL